MKHLSYILIAITSIVVGFADAQVLPKPVISPEPATVRIIEKNTDSDMSVGIQNHIALPIKSQTTFLNLVKEKEGVCTYEGEIHIDMTTYANIIHSRDNESVTIAGAILVPGKTTTMTYDNKTKSVSFKGQFAKLNKDITDYLHIDSLHNLYKDCDPSSIKSSYHRYCKTKTPEEMRDMLYRRYKKAERAIDSDKRFGAEFKEWWRAQIAAEVADKMFWYEYDYSDEHSEYKVGQYLRFCWDEIDPRKGYATFYLQNNASLAFELVLFYDDYYGKGTLLPEVEHLVAASDIAYYCCPLKLRPSRARMYMHMQASKNTNLGWLLLEESALFGNFAAAKQTSLPNHGQRYTFSRTADTKSTAKLLQQAKNPSDEPRNGR